MMYHFQSIHEGIKQKCDKCHKEFSQKGDLKIHIKNFHDGIRAQHKCHKCDKDFYL